jgi:hypothetical protein
MRLDCGVGGSKDCAASRTPRSRRTALARATRDLRAKTRDIDANTRPAAPGILKAVGRRTGPA